MTLIFVRPQVAMGIGNGRLGLAAPLPIAASITSASLVDLAPNASGWWDASFPGGLLGPNAVPLATWNTEGTGLADLTGAGQTLKPFFAQPDPASPRGSPHLSGLLGGVGYPTTGTGLLQPALHPDGGWTTTGAIAGPASGWTWLLVWSRPNWRQASGHDSEPVTLLAAGSTVLLQIDSQGGTNRLVIFPHSQGGTVLSASMARRHTHSIIIRYTPSAGADVWLDNSPVAEAMAWPPGVSPGNVVLLHDTTALGAAQCWLHEAANWPRALLDTEVAAVLRYLTRWTRGDRKGIFLLFNGQSNATNYALEDGAAALLARGVAWHLGALAYNVLATEGNPSSYTMQSGHGIYAVANNGYPYPGSFVLDPGDGSAPSGWSLGADGLAVEAAIGSMESEDLADVCAIIWPWSETDSLREYNELATFQAAAARFMSLLRTMINDISDKVPVMWWNAIPYGSSRGITMHRTAVRSMAGASAQHVIIGNPQTSDSNARGSSWDPATGLSSGGDSAHRDTADNLRFAVLAVPVLARSLNASGNFDSIVAIPDAIPQVGGPRIINAYRQSSTTIVVTITHDTGNDLRIPLQASIGAGFCIMDGGSITAPGALVSAVSCQRSDATHLRLELSQALQNPSALCTLYYPYGPNQIGRGNAVTDNYSSITKPAGRDAGSDLGPDWAVDYPLSATFVGVTLSDSYM